MDVKGGFETKLKCESNGSSKAGKTQRNFSTLTEPSRNSNFGQMTTNKLYNEKYFI